MDPESAAISVSAILLIITALLFLATLITKNSYVGAAFLFFLVLLILSVIFGAAIDPQTARAVGAFLI